MNTLFKNKILLTCFFVFLNFLPKELLANDLEEQLKRHTPEELETQKKFCLEVLKVVNLLRTNPVEFKNYLENIKKDFIKNRVDEKSYYKYFGKQKFILTTKEGLAAIDEAINYIDERMIDNPPLSGLEGNMVLIKSSLLHAKCMEKYKFFAHENEKMRSFYKPWDRVKHYCKSYTCVAENLWMGQVDDSQDLYEIALQVVLDLFIDDGVPNRGHRENLLLENITDLGIAWRQYGNNVFVFVMNFGAGIVH